VFRVEIRGIGDTVEYFKGVQQRLKTEPNKMTLNLARKLKEKVGIEIDKLGHDSSKGHNTLFPLKSRLHFRKFSGGHKVFMDEKPEGKTRNLPLIVEKGAEPHPITIKKGKLAGLTYQHPGFKGRDYWETGFANWESKDRKREIRRSVKKIVGKK